MTDFSVGPGVLQAMADNGDEPRSDEMYVVLAEGDRISTTYGSLAVYTWLERENVVKRSPFR